MYYYKVNSQSKEINIFMVISSGGLKFGLIGLLVFKAVGLEKNILINND